VSRIVSFYKGENVSPPYTIQEMWTWEGRRVEATYTFIKGYSLGALSGERDIEMKEARREDRTKV